MDRGEQEVRLARVKSIRRLAVDIAAFDLVPGDGRPFEPYAPGAHIDVHTPAGPVRQYSLCGDPQLADRYSIAVKREEGGRGGSTSMHRGVEVGSALGIAGPRNYFPLAAQDEGRSLLIAGGIGITPIFAMAQALSARAQAWELHYCARSDAHAAFQDEIAKLPHGTMKTYFSEAPLLDVTALLAAPRPRTHLYCCGPSALMKAVEGATKNWPDGRVHFEYFSAPPTDWPPNRAFEVELGFTGEVLTVPADRTILQVVRAHGLDVPSACEEGVCGTCETRVLAGEPEHRDVLLSPAEKAAGASMMVCVSRSRSARLVLEL